MSIPFIDLEAQYQAIKHEVFNAFTEIMGTKDFVQGKAVENFEKDFSKAQGSLFSVGCSNGTSAITVALKALDISKDDEVITVTNTFFATAEAIVEVGAVPVFVDCDSETYSMDLAQIESKITSNTKCIIPVHLYGNPVNMTEVSRIASKHKLSIVEDCAQSHLATWSGRGTGTFGNCGTFSFYPGKNLGAYGDAGAILMQDRDLHRKISMYVNHGRVEKYTHEFCGGNYRMDSLQAAFLSVKLNYLSQWTERRIELAKKYDSFLKNRSFKTMSISPLAKCVYHLFVVEVSNRQEVMEHFKNLNIGCGIHYPLPLHLQPALSNLNYKKNDFPVTERSADRILSLPLFAEMSDAQHSKVCEEFLKIAKV